MLLVMRRDLKIMTWSLLMLLFALVTFAVCGEWAKPQCMTSLGAIASIKSSQKTSQNTAKCTSVVAAKRIKKMQPSACTMDPQIASQRLKQLDKLEFEQQKIIRQATESQEIMVKAGSQGAASKEMYDKYKRDAEAAHIALDELKKLTDERISIYNATSKDNSAIAVANSTYHGYEIEVGMLSAQPLKTKELEKKAQELHETTMESVAEATNEVKSVQPGELDEEDKQVLANEIIPEGKVVQDSYKEVMQQLGIIIGEVAKIVLAAKAYGGGGRGALLGIATVMAVNMISGQNPFAIIKATSTLFKLLSKNTKEMNTAFNGYMQATGEAAGVTVEAASDLEEPDLDSAGKQAEQTEQTE